MRIADIPRLQSVFQTRAARTEPTGKVETEQQPTERVTLKGRSGEFAPLRSLSGKSLLAMASQTALQAASVAGLPAAVTSAFAPAEFLMLNSGDYHNAQHPVNVGETVKTIAGNAGRSPERVDFLGQVSLIHDADERILMDGQGGYSYKEGAAPARVPVTLAWMDLNQDALQDRFGWNGGQFDEAKALIAGTEHPLNDRVGPNRTYNLPEFDGKSSQAVLAEQLAGLPEERRAAVLEEIQMLRFADQSAEYLNGNDQARQAVVGLSSEIGVPAEALLKGTPSFVGGLGQDNEAFGDLPIATSRNLAAEFKLQAHIYEPAELHGLLSQPQRAALDGVKLGLE
ncbi:MAG: hypothetical protein AB7S38_32210 [Vulcanimicrobiota bacterium]